MPEGDVLRRVARRLSAALDDGPIQISDLRWPSLGGVDLTGLRSLGTVPYGKNLLTRFDDGRTLHTHLRMDGSWRIEARSTLARRPGLLRSASVRAVLAGSRWACLGRDLGMMHLVRTRDERAVIGHLGPDLLADDYHDSGREVILARVAADPGRPVGEVLLDQHMVAGIGTIYMAESLFRHRVSPWRATGEVDVGEVLDTARRLMLRSADGPELTATGDTRPGRRSLAHGRAGLPCPRCSTPIASRPVGHPPQERPGFHCPRCQRR